MQTRFATTVLALLRASLGESLDAAITDARAVLAEGDDTAYAGLVDVEIRETHRVHEHAASAIIRARKPEAAGCCTTSELEACCEPEAKDDCCGQPAVVTSAPPSCGCSTAA